MSDLVTIVLWALLVGNALRPPRLGGRAGFVVFVLGVTINELPLLFLVVVSAGVVSTLVMGAPDGLGGVAWSMAWALIVVGMFWLQIRARSTRPALEAALASALGNDWRATIRPELAASLSTRTPWLAGILRPFQRRHPRVVRVRNLSYGPDPRWHQLDLYRNPGSPAGRPILIHFHEGGSVQGSNDTVLPPGAPAAWAETLRSRSRSPVVYAELPHAQHAFDLFASVRSRVVAHAVEAFLAWSRSHRS